MAKRVVGKSVILFIDHAQVMGGAENSLLLLIQHLDRARFEPHLACPSGDLAEKAAALGIHCHTINLPRLRHSARLLLNWYTLAQQLAMLAKQIEASVLYANTVRAAMYGMLAAKMAKRPFLWHMHDFWLSETEPGFALPDRFFKWLIYREAKAIVTNSQATARHLPGLPNVFTVYNGIDPDKFNRSQDGNSFRQKYNIPLDVPLVGMVGRLRPWKGQENFIRVAASLTKTYPHVRYVIVGGSLFGLDDGYPRRLHQLGNSLKLSHRLRFTGHLADVRPALAAMDIFVHPGAPEPFGLVNIEAMAMGKPVVAFAHGALPEIVIHGETGLLVPPNNQTAMEMAVIRLLDSPELRQRLGRAGRQRVRENFTIAQNTAAIQSVLRTVLEKEE